MSMRRQGIIAIVLAGAVAFFYISGIPSVLFVNVALADADPLCIALFVNMVLIMAVGVPVTRILIPKIRLGFNGQGLREGLSKYWRSCLLAFAVPFSAFAIGLMPFDYRPTIWKIIIDGIVYYIGVGVVEEFFCRGLLMNGIAELLKEKENGALWAVILSAVIFGIGHFFGVAGQSPLIIACKITWATGLGIYLGAIYFKTKNLWLAAGFHAFIDFCGLPFCFSTQKAYPTVSAAAVLIVFLFIGAYGIYLLTND